MLGVYLVAQHAESASSNVLPLLTRSFGNCRSQHIFIDPSRPHSAYGMSYNCVSFSGNQRSFNDGYHTIHHLNSKLHWTQLPQQFIQVAEQGPMPGTITDCNDRIWQPSEISCCMCLSACAAVLSGCALWWFADFLHNKCLGAGNCGIVY